jgi:hypothetical protein
MFVFLGVLSVTALSALSFILIATFIDPNREKFDSLLLPLAVSVILSFLIVALFLGQFSTCVIAMIHCFGVDCDLNNGVPQFGPPSYHEKIASVYREDK